MNAITLKLVKVGDRYVGADVSTRWNLAALGYEDGIPADRNQTDLKRARRAWGGDFKFAVIRGGSVRLEPSGAERDALGGALALAA
jgi:hypothetical protein